jgi:hypothetical protein
LLDISDTFHMSFQGYLFAELNDNVEGEICFVYRSSLKHMGIGTVGLKLSGFLDFVLKYVLYLF